LSRNSVHASFIRSNQQEQVDSAFGLAKRESRAERDKTESRRKEKKRIQAVSKAALSAIPQDPIKPSS
jgi:hypothetical protein